MRLSSVYSARVAWQLDIDELNPHGKRLLPDLVPALVGAFEFSIFPETAAQMDPAAKTGIAFKNGRGPAVDKDGKAAIAFDFEIHANGIAVETKNSTDASEEILTDVAEWGVKEFGLNFNSAMIRKRLYISQLVFYPEGDFAKGLQKLNQFAGLLSDTPILGEVKKIDLTSLRFQSEGSDRWAFTFERRAGAPFSENKYFSLADVPTKVHLSLLTRFESLLSS